MILHTFLLMVAGAVMSHLFRFALNRRSRFKWRIVDEVVPFLQKPNPEQLEQALDAEEDRRLRERPWLLPDRRALRVKMETVRHEYRLMRGNALVGYEWGNTEWHDMIRHHLDYAPHLQHKIKELRTEGVQFAVAVNVALAKIWLLSLFPFENWRLLPLPSVAALRQTGEIDLRQAYQRVKEATIALASFYGEGEHAEEIRALM